MDVENLDTCRNEDLPPLLKQEAQPGTNSASSLCTLYMLSSVVDALKFVFVCLLLCLVILEEHHAKPTEKKRKLMYSLIFTQLCHVILQLIMLVAIQNGCR